MSTPLDFTGPGYFAGEPPDGLITASGSPVVANVRVYWRDTEDTLAPDVLVAQTTSDIDGTWRIVNINPDMQYVVRGYKPGFDDVTVVGVMPTRTDIVTATGSFTMNEIGNGLDGVVLVEGGLPPYTVTQVSPLPPGLMPLVVGHELTVVGEAEEEDNGSWQPTLRVVASNGPWVDIVFDVEIAIPPLIQPSFVAQAFVTVYTTDSWNPKKVGINETATQRYAPSVSMWERLDVIAPPLVYKEGVYNSTTSIPVTSGDFPVVSIVGTYWRVSASNGGYSDETQEGVYQFLNADGLEVFALRTYKTGTYASGLQTRIAGGSWSAVTRYGYGNGYCDVAFSVSGAVGVGNGGSNGWGGFTSSFDATKIVTVRCSVSATTSRGNTYSFLELLSV